MAADKNGDIWFEDVRFPYGTAPKARERTPKFSEKSFLGIDRQHGISVRRDVESL
jgi:hypothetical protein